MKILWLAHDGGLSGANICMLEYISILQKQGFEQELIAPYSATLVAKAEHIKIPVHVVPFYLWSSNPNKKLEPIWVRIRKWIRNTKAITQLKKLIKQKSPDYFVTNTITSYVGAVAAAKSNTKHNWFVHEFGEEDHGFTIAVNFLKGVKLINQLSYKVVFNSVAVQKKFEPFIDLNKRVVVYNSVNVPEDIYSNLPSEEKLKLLMLGQIAPSKNHLDALKALKICREKGLDFELNIIGKAEDSSYLNELNNYINASGLNECVFFLGQSSEPFELLKQHHILLMCSKMEAFGRVTVEALKCGVAVIGANTGGTLEIIEDGMNGYLYSSGNVEDLADKIMLLHKTYAQFNKDNISKKVREKFNENNTLKQLLNVFN